MNTKEFDIICWGTTGFTGHLVIQYMAKQLASGLKLKIAMGGRNEARLKEIREELEAEYGAVARQLGIVVGRAESPKDVVARTRVILSTVGPFALHGEPMVRACVEAGVHYVDITGETAWVRMLIDKYHERARSGGTKIVPMCGFDSIPSDLGALLAYEAARKRWPDARVERIDAYVRMKGSASGGTVASIAEVMKDRNVLRQVQRPFLLNPEEGTPAPSAEDSDVRFCHYAADAHGWAGPFVMAAANTRVVRRTQALMQQDPRPHELAGAMPYREFVHYQEYHVVSSLTKMLMMMVGMLAFVLLMSMALTRWAVRKVLPKPSQGPSKEERSRSFFRWRMVARTSDGKSAAAVVAGGDPGYDETAKMLSEAAICLAVDAKRLPDVAGVLTPATAFGHVLIDRLKAANMTLEEVPVDESQHE